MTTTMETIVLSPDMSTTKTEIFDVDMARQLAEDKNIPKEERDKLKRYLKNRVRGNQHDTTYKLGKNIKHEYLGRFCALRGESLQGLSRDIRNALASEYYWDLDIVNAQPTLLVQYAERNGWKSEATRKYIEYREEILSELCDVLNIERWEAKNRIIALFFGSTDYTGLPSFFTDELCPELRLIMKNNWELNKSKLKFLEKQPNHYGKGLADILQTEERNCLISLDKALAKHGRSLDVYIHDGGLVRKKESETNFPKLLISQLEKEIETETGYKISLVVKPMKTSFVKQENNEDNYALLKEKFEETGWKGATYFKLREPASFMMITKDKSIQISRTDLLQNEEDNKLNDGSLFIKRWLEDPDKKEYNEVVFRPQQEVQSSQFNLWRGFPITPQTGDYSVYQQVLDLLVNHDKNSFQFVEKWLASVVQRPYEKTKVALIFTGSKGIGKDTFWNAFGYHILGQYFVSTGKPEHDLFGRFGGATAKKLLVKIEEGNFATNKENEERFKNLITCEKDNLEQKGKETITIDSYCNIVITTNQSVPVVLSPDERRFAMFDCSDERRGDVQFWNYVHSAFKHTEIHRAYLHYLLGLDISDFNAGNEAKKNMTEIYNQSLQSFIPYHAKWFQMISEEREGTIEWKARDLLHQLRTSHYVNFALTETKAGTDLRSYIKAGVITKNKSTIISYVLHIDKLIPFLKEKGWYTEF